MAETEVRYRIVGDASSGVAASKEAASGLEDFASKTEEAGKKSEKANEHHREQHRIFRQLDQILPGLGESIKAAFNPEVAGLIGFGVVLELTIHSVEKLIEKYSEWIKQQSELSLAIFEGNQKAAESAALYAEKLRDIESKSRAVKDQEDLRLSILKETDSIQEKIAKTEEARSYAAEQSARKELALKEALLKEEKERSEVLKGIARDTEAGAESGAAESEIAKKRIEQRGPKLLEAQEQVNKAASAVGFAAAAQSTGALGALGEDFLVTANSKFESATKKLDELKAAQEEDEKAVRKHEESIRRSQKALEDYSKSVEDIRTKEADVTKTSALLGVRERGSAQEALAQTGGFSLPRIQDTPITERMVRAIQAERAIGRGQTIDQSQAADIQFLSNLLHTVGLTNKQIVTVLKSLQSNYNDLSLEVQRLGLRIRTRNINQGG